MKSQQKFTGSEKKLFLVTGLALALILGFGAWWQRANTVPVVEFPAPKLPSPNAYDFYVKAGAAIIPDRPAVDPINDFREVPKSQWETRYPVEKKAAWVRRNAPALSLLRQGFRYPCRVTPRRGTPSPYGYFRSMARLLVVESRVQSARGAWGDAAESTLDGFELGHDIVRGGVFIDFLVGSSVNKTVCGELREIHRHLSADEAKSAASRLENIIQTRVPFAEVLEREKRDHQSKFAAAMQSDRWDADIEILLDLDRYTGAERTIQRWRMSNTPRRIIFDNYTNYMDALIAASRKPYTKQAPLPPIPGDFYNDLVTPLFGGARWNYARDEAANALILLGLALRAYKLEQHRYPRTLSELVPRYLKKVPIDPYDGGEPLRYKVRDAEHSLAAYSLYSIGPDGVDNNGRAIENTSFPKESRMRLSVQPESEGDMVAGINN